MAKSLALLASGKPWTGITSSSFHPSRRLHRYSLCLGEASLGCAELRGTGTHFVPGSERPSSVGKRGEGRRTLPPAGGWQQLTLWGFSQMRRQKIPSQMGCWFLERGHSRPCLLEWELTYGNRRLSGGRFGVGRLSLSGRTATGAQVSSLVARYCGPSPGPVGGKVFCPSSTPRRNSGRQVGWHCPHLLERARPQGGLSGR